MAVGDSKLAVAGIGFLLWISAMVGQGWARSGASERALWSLWRKQTASPTDHPGMIAACSALENELGEGDPLRSVVCQIRAWHLLKAGETQAALRLLDPMCEAGGTVLERAVSQVARTWATRIERESVRAALKAHYHRHIAFPESLADLRASEGSELPPLSDRWGTPWVYRLKGFRLLSHMPNQKYELLSRRLGHDSDLEEALEVPFAGRITLVPVRVVSVTAAPVVQFVDEAASPEPSGRRDVIHIATGGAHGRILFPFMGETLILLCDGDHWKVLLKPRA